MNKTGLCFFQRQYSLCHFYFTYMILSMKKAQFKDLSKFMVLAKTELLDLKLMQTVETDSDSLQEQSDQGIHCSVLTSLSASD